MKKLLFLLLALVTITTYAQTANGSETQFEAVQITNPQTVTSAVYVVPIGTDGTMGKIEASKLPLTDATINAINTNATPDATTSVKGKVKLAGDLGGTADLPTVPGLSVKEPTITAGTTSQYWRGDKTWQTLNKAAVGLSNVDNTSDASKPISTATQTALNLKANINSQVFTGTPEAPDPTTTQGIVTKNYADNLVVGLLNDRGSWDASTNLFPTTGGSGTAGAIRKGDMWFVSVGGILAGKTVTSGDSFRALANTPGQTAGNWSVLEANIGYVPANDANVIHTTGNESKAGILTMSSNSATIQAGGLDLTQSNVGGQVLKITNNSTNTAVQISNLSTGIGSRVDTSGGTGYLSSATGGAGFGASISGVAGGFVATSNSTGSGAGFSYQSGVSSTGPAFIVTSSAVAKLSIDKEGSTTYTPTLTATANGQTLRNIIVNPTFVNGAFTGIIQYAIDVQNGNVRINGATTSNSFVKSGATSSDILLGDGTTSQILSVSAVLDFPSTLANSTSTLTITSTGAVVGDVVTIGTPVPDSGCLYYAYVSASNAITVRFINMTIMAVDPASATFKTKILK